MLLLPSVMVWPCHLLLLYVSPVFPSVLSLSVWSVTSCLCVCGHVDLAPAPGLSPPAASPTFGSSNNQPMQ